MSGYDIPFERLEPNSSTVLQDERMLRIRSGYNVRELGGYNTPNGPTLYHRFLRSGATRSLTTDDLALLRNWGVTRVADLRSFGESPRQTCRFARRDWVRWESVPLYDYDLSSPTMTPVRDIGGYFVSGYLHMLSAHKAIKHLFEFFAQAQPHECVLFHCAAGMDRTGVAAMLLLGLAGASRRDIVADYAFSFGTVDEVDRALDAHGDALEHEVFSAHLYNRMRIIATVYDTILHEHGSVRAFLLGCGLSSQTLDNVVAHLVSSANSTPSEVRHA